MLKNNAWLFCPIVNSNLILLVSVQKKSQTPNPLVIFTQ